MTDLPPAAITAAVAAYAREAYVDGEPIEGDERVIRAALEAAAPVLAEHVAQAILSHLEDRVPLSRLAADPAPELRAYRRHFATAARIAAGAFDTRADQLRMAADAIARGDVIVCDIPEGGPVREDDTSGR